MFSTDKSKKINTYGNDHVACNMLGTENMEESVTLFDIVIGGCHIQSSLGVPCKTWHAFECPFNSSSVFARASDSLLPQASGNVGLFVHHSAPFPIVRVIILLCFCAGSMTSLGPSFVYILKFVSMTLSNMERNLTSDDFGHCLYQANSHDNYPKHNTNRSWNGSPASAT